MFFFYTAKDITLPMKLTKAMEEINLTAPPLIDMDVHQISDQHLYISTDSHSKKLRIEDSST
ncbi:MAG: hypothetical protein A2Y40_03440 [Candidatus Margulisbacteria bacterium GWF2_35_9]|nr:MAG: hypothetical protein A2Y40_03440 [Candidatus Margulisbacteria bacterium GWF2_35_9]